MKRKGLVAVLAAIMVFASSIFCFADESGLKLVSSYPEDGQKNTSIENVGVKLYFNRAINNAAVRKADAKLVKIVDSKGKAIKTQVLFSDADEGMVLVVADNTDKAASVISSSETYTLVLDADFADDNGDKLGKETTITFKTYNQKVNNAVNMVMMFVMFGGIMVVTLKQQKDQQREQMEAKQKAANGGKEVAFNPYREAKRTGKSVEEVMAEEAKRQEKAAKKRKKKDAPEEHHGKKIICADYLTNVYHVHKPASVNKRQAAKAEKK